MTRDPNLRNFKLIKSDIPDSIEHRMVISTKLVMPEDLNPAGSLFGGTMMAWMDKVSAMLAQRVARGNVVTASVSEIGFKAPGKCGDQIELTGYLKKLGNTSLQVYVDAYRISIEPDGAKKTLIADAVFSFVHLGEDGKPKYIER